MQELETKKMHLLEIEEILHEINAECQYMVLHLEEDIEQFCMPFTKQQLQPNGNLINEVVSEAVVPLICATHSAFKPHFVHERSSESELMRKYLAISTETTLKVKTNDEIAKPTRSASQKRKPLVNAAQATTEKKVPAKAAQPLAVARTTGTGAGTESGVGFGSEEANKNEVVNASRLQLQAALKRARQKRNQIANCENKTCSPKEMFLQSFGLCTLLEHKNIMQSRALPRKKPSRSSIRKWISCDVWLVLCVNKVSLNVLRFYFNRIDIVSIDTDCIYII